MQNNFEKFLSDLVKPLCTHPEDVKTTLFSDEDDVVAIQIMVNEEDLGRVIGKKGRVINSIRTIAFTYASRFGKKIEVSVDSF